MLSRIAIPSPFASGATRTQQVAGAVALVIIAKLGLAFGVFPTLLGGLGDAYNASKFPDHYDGLAENLLAGLGYRVFPETGLSLLREPGWPLVLAAMFAVFGKSLTAIQVLNVALTFCTASLTYLIGTALLRSRAVGALAAMLVLFHPAVFVAESRGGMECFAMFLYALSIWLALRAIEHRRVLDFAAFGLIFGAAMLTRSSLALLFPALLAACYLLGRDKRAPIGESLRGFTLAAICTLLVMSPWIARNLAVSGYFVPTMTTSGLAIFQGVYVVKHHTSGERVMDTLNRAAGEQLRIANEMGLAHKPGYFPLFFTAADEVNFYRELGARGLNEYRKAPALLIEAVGHNSLAFWFQGRTPTATILNVAITAPLLLLAGLGAWHLRRERFALGVLLLCVLAVFIPHLLIIGLARYHIPVVPLIALLAATPLAMWAGLTSRPVESVKVGVLS